MPFRPPPTLARRLAEQRPGDDQTLDLARALVDLGHLRVAVVALDRELLGVAIAAEDLDRLACPVARDARGEELGLGALHACAAGPPPSGARRATRARGRPRSRSACRRASAGWRRSRRSGARRRGAPARRPRPRRAPPGRCPTAWAAMPMRPPSRVWRAMRMPAPFTPSSSAGVSSKLRSAVEEEFRPIFSSSRVTAKPVGAAAHDEADARSGSRAKTRKLCACEPLVIHCLVPVMLPSTPRASASHRRPSPSPTRSARRPRARVPAPAAGPSGRPARACRGSAAAACPRSCGPRRSPPPRRRRARAPRARARRTGSRRPRRRAPRARTRPSAPARRGA